MAVNLTLDALRSALRLSDNTDENMEAARLLAYATVAVEKNAPAAPTSVQNEAVIRIAAYLFDQPTSSRGATYANAGKNSGAWSMLLPYRVHRAGHVA